MTNKYGVPYKEYTLELENSDSIQIDVGVEEDWGNIQSCIDDNLENYVGWGNDLDGHERIIKVTDSENNEYDDIFKWANECVWCYVNNYGG